MHTIKPSFAKVLTTPTQLAWSQTYSAGTLAGLITLSFNKKSPDKQNQIPLNEIGRNLMSNLETEYFSLEKKNLVGLKKIAETLYADIPDYITPTIILTSIAENNSYFCLIGKGKIYIKRNEKIGVLLQKTEDTIEYAQMQTLTASGQIKDNDMIILISNELVTTIPNIPDYLTNESIGEIADQLTIQLENKKQPNATALILLYNEEENPLHIAEIETGNENEEKEEKNDETPEEPITPINQPPAEKKYVPKIRVAHIRLPKVKKIPLALSICAIIIALLLIGSITITLIKQNSQKQQARIDSIYSQSLTKYHEGQSLLTLNKTEAKSDFSQAKDQLNTLPKDALQTARIRDLLQKISQGLTQAEDLTKIPVQAVDDTTSPLLKAEKDNSAYTYTTEENQKIYLGNNTEIKTISPPNTTLLLFANNRNTWNTLAGLAAYNGSVYLLDTNAKQIFKLTKGSTLSTTKYLKTSIDISTGIAITIDGDIWMLTSDGNILKFTRGQQDPFTISGLTTPFKNPTRIFTTRDSNNLYILDPKNSRIVSLAKTGQLIAEYKADEIQQASDLDVSEKDKKIFFLANKKMYQIAIQ